MSILYNGSERVNKSCPLVFKTCLCIIQTCSQHQLLMFPSQWMDYLEKLATMKITFPHPSPSTNLLHVGVLYIASSQHQAPANLL